MKNDRVYILRESVVKITQMLSGKGIKVTQQGVNAYVKADHNGTPILVNLPYLPDNAGEDLCNAIQGFLDHEVAHILFTNFPLMGTAMRKGRQVGFLLNALEDPRIEKCMAERFQGSAYNLATTGKFYLDKFVMPKMKEAAASGDANKVIQVLMVPMLRAMSGQQVFKEFMKDHWSKMAPVYERIKDLQSKIEAASSTEDCMKLAEEISDRLKDEGEGEGKGKGEKSESASSSKSAGKGTGKGEKDKSKGASSSKGGKDEEKEEEETTPAGGESEKAPPKDEKEGEGKAEDEKPEDEEEEGKPTPEKDEKKDEEDKPEPSEPESSDDEEEDEGEFRTEDKPSEEEPADDDSSGGEAPENEDSTDEVTLDSSRPIWDELDKDGANGYDESMSRIISQATASAALDADYVVFTKEHDVVEKLPIGSGYDSKMTQRLCDAVDHMVAPLQKDLERAVAARSLSQRSHGHRSGRLHAPNLTRLHFGDDRVFSRKHESQSKDVAVELVVDCSGSMSGSKIHTACQSAYALSAVLDRLNIKNEVIGFTTKGIGGAQEEMYKQQSTTGVRFSRVEGIYMPILKGYEERMTAQVKERFGWLPNTNILRSNVDGESIEVAARRLMARREEGKIMIVLSDGYPAAAGSGNFRAHLKKTAKEIEKAGVRLVGIGIESDAVKEFYSKNLILNSVNDLPAAVIKELRHLLMV